MWPPSDGDAATIGFLLLLAILAAILWVACPDDYPTSTEGFDPKTWCDSWCCPDPDQAEPCEDCPYLGPPVPRHMREEE